MPDSTSLAEIKISQLPVATAANDTDQIEANQSGTSRSVTVAQIKTAAAAAVANTVNVKTFGAKGDGVTDDATAIQAALNAGSNEVVVPVGVYRCASGITVPAGVTLRGFNFLPDNPPTHGSVLKFDATVPTCVTLSGIIGANGLQCTSLREISVSRVGPFPPTPLAGSIGVLVNLGYNVIIKQVMVYSQSIGFKWFAGTSGAASGGLGTDVSYIYTGGISDAHMVVDGWPELYCTNSRFGMNGTNNLNCSTFIRVQGGVPGTAGGPNTVNFTNCQFNQGGGGSPSYFCSFVNKAGPGAVDATSFKFISCHIENISTAYFYSDATFDQLKYLWCTACGFHQPVPMFALNAATQPWNWHIVGCEIEGSITLAPTAAFVETAFIGCAVGGNVSLTSGNSVSCLSWEGNSINGSLTLAGTWTSLVVNGGTISTLVNNAKGNIAIDLPGVTAGFQRTTMSIAGEREIERSSAYNTTPTNNDGVFKSTYVTNSSGTLVQAVRQHEWLNNVTAGAEVGMTYWEFANAGVLTSAAGMSAGALYPISNNAMQLGVQGAAWSQVNIASGGFINFGTGGTTSNFQQVGADLLFSGSVYFSGGRYGTPITTVALLPAAASNTGFHAMVGDATVTTFGSVVVGGGANKVPVYSDGTNWRIG